MQKQQNKATFVCHYKPNQPAMRNLLFLIAASAQSRLGGMVNGVPEAMDGFKLWEREPVGVPRITDRTDGRADRLKALGNAVCPPQVFPILKFISDIETGRCKKYCEFGGEQI